MCGSMYVYVSQRMYESVYVCTLVCESVSMCGTVCMYVCAIVYPCVGVCMCVGVYLCVRICLYGSVSLCECVFVSVCGSRNCYLEILLPFVVTAQEPALVLAAQEPAPMPAHSVAEASSLPTDYSTPATFLFGRFIFAKCFIIFYEP